MFKKDLYVGIWAGIKSITMYTKSLVKSGIVTVAMTAKQWALNIAMDANPIGLIVIAIAALVAGIVIAIKYYDKFGAVLLTLMVPIGIFVNAIMTIKRNWNSIVEAFTDGGIIAGIKRIGIVLLDLLLYPMQQLLKILSRIPGLGHLADKGHDVIADMRKNLNLAAQSK